MDWQLSPLGSWPRIVVPQMQELASRSPGPEAWRCTTVESPRRQLTRHGSVGEGVEQPRQHPRDERRWPLLACVAQVEVHVTSIARRRDHNNVVTGRRVAEPPRSPRRT